MIVLQVKDTQGKVTDEFYLGDGTHTIGRVPENTVVLKDMKVSRSHAELRIAGNQCFIKDLGSRTGTLVNKQAITAEAEIHAGDQILLGDEILEIAAAEEKMTDVKESQIGRLDVIAPEDVKRNIFFLDKKEASVMGRIPECAIQVLDKQASKEHAKISFDGKHYFVEDEKSMNGTMVNSRKISPNVKTLLKVGDVIGIGNYRYKFDISNESERKQVEETQKATAVAETQAEKATVAKKEAEKKAKSGSSLLRWATFLIIMGGLGAGGYGYYYEQPWMDWAKPYLDKVKDKVFPPKQSRTESGGEVTTPQKPVEIEYSPVAVSRLAKKTFSSFFEETGSMEPFNKVYVVSTLIGDSSAEFMKVNVRDGQNVEKGTIVAVQNIRYLKKDLEAANTQLEKAFSGEAGIKKVVNTTLESVKLAEDHMNKMKKMSDQGVVPETHYTEARGKYLSAKADNEKASTDLKTLQDEINTIKSKIEKLKERMKDAKITAPISGKISALTAKEGEHPRNPIMEILDISSVYAILWVPEKDVVTKVWKERELFSLEITENKYIETLDAGQVSNLLRKEFEQQKQIALSPDISVQVDAKGEAWTIEDKTNRRQYSIENNKTKLKVIEHQPVYILSASYPDTKFYGFVSKIGTEIRNVDRTLEVKVKIPNPESKLTPGSFIKAQFLVGEKQNVPAILKESVMTLVNKKFLYIVKNVETKDGKKTGIVQKVPIETGYEDDKYYEITSSIADIKDNPIVTEGQLKLSDESPVKITRESE